MVEESQEEKTGMEIGIGSGKISQICLCTHNLERAERCWTHILGREPLHKQTPEWMEVPSFTDGAADRFHPLDFLVYELEGMILEIFGPGEPDTPWRRYLDTHGDGVMNLAFFVPDRQKAYDVISEVCDVNGPYHEGFYLETTYSFMDTEKELGVQLNIKCREENADRIGKAAKERREAKEGGNE